MSRSICTVNKAHCFRTIVADPTDGQCVNGCKFCYSRKFDPIRRSHSGNRQTFSTDTVRRQLARNGNGKLISKLKEDRVIRIGAMSDIVPSSRTSINNYMNTLQIIHDAGYHYILVTKSAGAILDEPGFLELIRDTNGILGVTTAYYSNSNARKFENIVATPPIRRRELVGAAIRMGINVVLRLNPIHPDFMGEHIKVLDWYMKLGGTRVILEALRIMSSWAENMPEVDFSSYVTKSNGGCYNGYYTPHRGTQEHMFTSMIDMAQWLGIQYGTEPIVTICGDMESQDKFGRKGMDCCQASDIFDLPVPPRTWEE